jgi:hypothetical protein
MEDSLQAIGERVREVRDDRDWKQFHRPTRLAAALAVEVAELQELFLRESAKREAEILPRTFSLAISEMNEITGDSPGNRVQGFRVLDVVKSRPARASARDRCPGC